MWYNVGMIYLDHAAATPVDARVLRAMEPYFGEKFYNPSAAYLPAKEVAADYEAAKGTIAHAIGAKGADIVITAGATEANNLAFTALSPAKPAGLRSEDESILQRRGVRSLARRGVAPAAHGRRPEESSEERTGSFFRDDDGSATSVDGPAGRAPECDINVSSPGFLNFSLTDDYLKITLDRLVDDYGSDVYKGQTVICEFSDPNPFKVLHVGHLYTSIVGDSIARLFEYAGAKVIRANFGGDVGLHVAKTMYALQQKPIKDLTIEDIAKCYIEGTAAYEDDPSAHESITKLNKAFNEAVSKAVEAKLAGKTPTDYGDGSKTTDKKSNHFLTAFVTIM